MKKAGFLLLLLVVLVAGGDRAWMSAATAQSTNAQGGGYAAQRERLVTGLRLDVRQQARLDAITAEMLPRVLALNRLERAERGPAHAKLMVELQQKINAMLTPDQRATYELMQASKDAAGNAAAAKSAASGAAGS